MIQKILRYTFISICLLISIPIVALLTIESYFPFKPYIDTRFSKDFEEKVFDKIALGETQDEVLSKLGEPIWKEGCGGCWEPQHYTVNNVFRFPTERVCSAPCKAQNAYWKYTDDGACTWWDFAWKEFSLEFNNGVVAKKFAQWHGD